MIKQIMKDKTITATDIAKRFGVSRATIQRGLRKDREDAEVIAALGSLSEASDGGSKSG